MAKIGRTRAIVMSVQDAHSALAIVSRTDMIAMAPRRLATAFAQRYGLKLFEPPYGSPVIAIEAFWRRDPGGPSAVIDWLREAGSERRRLEYESGHAAGRPATLAREPAGWRSLSP